MNIQSEALLIVSRFLEAYGLPWEVVKAVSDVLTFENPEIKSLKQRGKRTDTVEPFVYFYQYKDHVLCLPRGALALLIRELRSRGIPYEVLRAKTQEKVSFPPHRISLRPYQGGPIERIVRQFEDWPCQILLSEAGSGKTVSALYIAHTLGVRTLWLTDQENLFSQAKERIQQHLGIPEEDIGEIVGPTFRIGPQITVGMIQTLANRDVTPIETAFGLLVLDECTCAPTKNTFKVVSSFAPEYTLGLTAFAWRGDGLIPAIFATVGEIGVAVPPAGVVYPKVIKRYTGRNYQWVDFVPWKRKVPDFAIYRRMQKDEKRNRLIVDDIGLYPKEFPTLVLSKTVEHLYILQEETERLYGIPSVLTHSDTKRLPKKERSRNEQAFLDGEVDLMFGTYPMFAKGYDNTRLSRLVWAMPFSSDMFSYQSSGRIAREHNGKRGAILLDYVDSSERLENQSRNRDDVMRGKGLEIVLRDGKDYLTDEDKILLFGGDDEAG